jgi:hypothetical protein
MFVDKRKENVILKLLIPGKDFKIPSIQIITRRYKIRLNAIPVLFRDLQY